MLASCLHKNREGVPAGRVRTRGACRAGGPVFSAQPPPELTLQVPAARAYCAGRPGAPRSVSAWGDAAAPSQAQPWSPSRASRASPRPEPACTTSPRAPPPPAPVPATAWHQPRLSPLPLPSPPAMPSRGPVGALSRPPRWLTPPLSRPETPSRHALPCAPHLLCSPGSLQSPGPKSPGHRTRDPEGAPGS